ncbi:DUF305 domain-containing protein [Nonomuraea sp. NPDC059194]|uniref:DUF305 domain-containing protein n=1 Tax=Nonomuraea sp. NPDC059194 TaxID=3346764 RepID=UPI0036C80E05
MEARLIAALAAALLLAAGCGEPPQEQVNADDVMFLQMMIPHHKQGIEIVRLAGGRATTAEMKTLAAAIERTQSAEVAMMTRWLTEWDQPLTAPSDAHAGHGGLPETDRERVAAVRNERDLVNLLIAHQDDAIQMARVEVYNGLNPQVKEWARQVERSRDAQIDQMLTFLGPHPSPSA